ncbi:unnamed protein product [Rhizophagus irregularis]|nr:unnamed protein product [Rhizophagus irregularis]
MMSNDLAFTLNICPAWRAIRIIYSNNMSLDNINQIIESLSGEPNKLSEDEKVKIFLYLTGNVTILAEVENICKLLQTNSAKLKYFRGLSKRSGSEQSVAVELSKKRKALEGVKKTWKVNSTLRETDWPYHYFVDPVAEGKQQEEQESLFEKIEKRSFIMLYGTRASGKSTRAMRTISVLENDGYVCNYVTFEHIVNDGEGFWNSLCTNISIYKRSSEYLESCANIYNADDFLIYFSIGWKRAEKDPNKRVVLFFDEEFEDDNKMQFEEAVIDDIFEQTTGHAGLVSLCGRAIEDNLLRKLDKRLLTYKTWECYKVSSLMGAMVDYQTFRNLVNSLKSPEAKDALNFFRNNFLVDVGYEVKVTTDIDSAEYLASEGVLVPGEEAGAFKLSSPLVRWLILQRVIPNVFPSRPREEIPFFKDSQDLDTLIALKYAVKTFDKSIISLARFRSFKTAKVLVNGKRKQHVPRESVYDAELCRILRNWLSVANFEVTGQWHLISNGNRYSDIVIDTPFGEKIVLELLATADTNDLDEHFRRSLDYARLLSVDETWVVHITCEDNYVERPHWPSDSQLKMNLNVVHFYHDPLFTRINLIAGCWSNRKNKMLIYEDSTEI